MSHGLTKRAPKWGEERGPAIGCASTKVMIHAPKLSRNSVAPGLADPVSQRFQFVRRRCLLTLRDHGEHVIRQNSGPLDENWQQTCAAHRFGPRIAEQLSPLLDELSDPDRIAAVATMVFECENGEDFIARAREV